MKKTFISGFLVILLIACGDKSAPANPTTNSIPNETEEKQTLGEPKRIVFTKGSTNSIEYFDLKVGESKQFVIGVSKGQDVIIGNGGDIEITMITKGKMTEETNDSTSYHGITTAGGDLVFEVKNTAKNKIESSVNVLIETNRTQ